MPHEETIFEQALEIDSPQAREEFLRTACAADEAMFQRLLALLGVHDRAGKFAEHVRPDVPSGLAPGSTASPCMVLTEKPGDRVGRYKLLQKIGEGGCGVVYMAEQEEPVRRRVALKIIKLGMDTRQVTARFEAERQALALMDHPGIAKVHDAGATETGRPYFVMELVRGVKITEYCDEKKLTTHQRLELFMQVCRAVQHAHQKGIIHRDLKPSNILISLNDGVAVPKVIDFGIAKATTGEPLTDKTVFTAFEQFIGTPAYMSPEQALVTSLDIDTRTDIYALGVLLYELLTGKTPFDAKELMQAGLDEMRRTIREKEPARPSTRLSTLPGDALSTTAHLRGLDAPKLVSQLRADLDWIVMKCLEKDRARRYETANGLATDIQRHLSNEPVVARPPSNLYRFRKVVRRHRLVFGAITSVLAALVIGLGVALWQSVEKAHAYNLAKIEATKSKQVSQFLKDMLEGVGPSAALGRDTTMLREILAKTLKRVTNDLHEQPDVEAELLSTMGAVYFELGEYQKSEAIHREALALRKKLFGNEHLEVADSLNQLQMSLWKQHKRGEAESMAREALAMRRKLLGNEHIDVAQSLNNLGTTLSDQRKVADAEVVYREALALTQKLGTEEHPLVVTLLNNLGNLLDHEGTRSESELMRRKALDLGKKLFGDEHPIVIQLLNNLATALLKQRKLDEAEILGREAWTVNRKLLGDEHPDVAASVEMLATILLREKKYDEAEKLFADQLESVSLLRRRADFRGMRGQFAEAAADFTRILEQDPEQCSYRLAVALAQSGSIDAYREHCRRSAERFADTTDPVTAEHIAKACLILPASGVAPEIIDKLADTSASESMANEAGAARLQFPKGLADYRQGRFASAAQRMQKVLSEIGKDPSRDAQALREVQGCTVLAMAQYQLRQSHEARITLARGVEIANAKIPKLDSGDLGGSWVNCVIAHVLMREAKELIAGEQNR
jgi:serine/threonine protein kinase